MSEREASQSHEKGAKNYREMIHADSKRSDTHSNLPFTFSKPNKSKPSNVHVECGGCGKFISVTSEAILSICGDCNYMNRIKK